VGHSAVAGVGLPLLILFLLFLSSTVARATTTHSLVGYQEGRLAWIWSVTRRQPRQPGFLTVHPDRADSKQL
jgi:hypothetical protein